MGLDTVMNEITIYEISEPHGRWPGVVDVAYRSCGDTDSYETKRIALSEKVINADGSYDYDTIFCEVNEALA